MIDESVDELEPANQKPSIDARAIDNSDSCVLRSFNFCVERLSVHT